MCVRCDTTHNERQTVRLDISVGLEALPRSETRYFVSSRLDKKSVSGCATGPAHRVHHIRDRGPDTCTLEDTWCFSTWQHFPFVATHTKTSTAVKVAIASWNFNAALRQSRVSIKYMPSYTFSLLRRSQSPPFSKSASKEKQKWNNKVCSENQKTSVIHDIALALSMPFFTN